jgi:hypothetical protein
VFLLKCPYCNLEITSEKVYNVHIENCSKEVKEEKEISKKPNKK